MRTTNKQFIKEVPWGVYVWQLPDGQVLGDDEGHILLTDVCEEGNQSAIKAITQAAKGYGFPDGQPVYWSGKRPISDEEYERQLSRAKEGLVPDPLDIAAINEEMRALKIQNG